MNSPSQNLTQTIALLEMRQEQEWSAIKEQINSIQENLKPLTIIKTVVDEIWGTVGSKNSILKTVFRLGIGYLSNKILKGTAQSKFKNFVDSLFSCN